SRPGPHWHPRRAASRSSAPRGFDPAASTDAAAAVGRPYSPSPLRQLVGDKLVGGSDAVLVINRALPKKRQLGWGHSSSKMLQPWQECQLPHAGVTDTGARPVPRRLTS